MYVEPGVGHGRGGKGILKFDGGEGRFFFLFVEVCDILRFVKCCSLKSLVPRYRIPSLPTQGEGIFCSFILSLKDFVANCHFKNEKKYVVREVFRGNLSVCHRDVSFFALSHLCHLLNLCDSHIFFPLC